MFVRSNIDCVIDPIDHVTPVAREQRSDVDVALLQFLVRIQLIKRALQLPVRSFVSPHLRPVKSRAQSLELVIDFAPPGFQRVGKRRIHAA